MKNERKYERALALHDALLYSTLSFVLLAVLVIFGWLPKITPALADIPGLPVMKHSSSGVAQYFFDLPRFLWFVTIPLLIFTISYYSWIVFFSRRGIKQYGTTKMKGMKGGVVVGVLVGLVVGLISWGFITSFDLTVTWITIWFIASVLTGILFGETIVKTSFFGSSFSVVAGTVSGVVLMFKYLVVLKGLGFFGIIGVIGAGIGLFVAIATFMSVLPMVVAIVEGVSSIIESIRSMPFWLKFKKTKTKTKIENTAST